MITKLVAERDAAKNIIALLEEEKIALMQGSIERLEEVIAKKTEKIEQLRGLTSQRETVLISQALTPDRNGMETWIKANPSAKDIWEELLQSAQIVSQLSQINEALIRNRLLYTQQALAVLTGASNANPLYGPDGQTVRA